MNENLCVNGWKPIPFALKTLAVIMILWMAGTVMNLSNLMENGLPFYGVFIYGSAAFAIAFTLDILGPLVFLFGLWYRKPWSVFWAFAYIGVFVLNGFVTFFLFRMQLGIPQILVPTLVSLTCLAVIFLKRDYFTPGNQGQDPVLGEAHNRPRID